MFGGVLELHGFTAGLPNHFEAHSCRSSYSVERGPLRLIDHRDVFHFNRESVSVRADVQSPVRNWDDPAEAGGRNGRVKIVDLILGGNLSPEQRKSYVGEGSVLR